MFLDGFADLAESGASIAGAGVFSIYMLKGADMGTRIAYGAAVGVAADVLSKGLQSKGWSVSRDSMFRNAGMGAAASVAAGYVS